MDHGSFDRLVRLFGKSGTRRAAVSALLGTVLGGTVLESEAARKRGKGKGKRNGKGRAKGRKKPNGQGKKRKKKQKARAEAAPPGCYTGTRCQIGRLKNAANCDFEGSGAFTQTKDLWKSNLSNASLRGVNATGVNFTDANLSNACLVGTNLTGATLTRANLSNAIRCHTTRPDGSSDVTGCGLGTACCPTCDSTLLCPSGLVCCDHRCQPGECCTSAQCSGGEVCCGGQCQSSTNWAPLTTFGNGQGPGTDQFHFPFGVAVSADEKTAWVADLQNNRIAVWTRTGPTAWAPLTTFGNSGPNQLNGPSDVALSADEQTAWVADTGNNRIAVWTKTGPTTWALLTTFGGPASGADPSLFNAPRGVAVSPDGQTVWVGDTNNHRVSIWAKIDPTTWVNQFVLAGVIAGPNLDQFNSPAGVAVSADGQTVWVADNGNDRVSIWTKTDPTTWEPLTTFGTLGSDADQFSSPFSVALATDEQRVWVADRGANNRIAIWMKTGPTTWENEVLLAGPGAGSMSNQFNTPSGVAVSADGQTVWVGDTNNARISVWTLRCPAG